jgi:hypothetical protein
VAEGEDRFGDLGERRPSAAERLAAGDEAELAAERREQQRTGPPKPSSAYSWVVGIAFLILVVVVGVNSLPNAGDALHGPKPGSTLPDFAAPAASGSNDQVANIKQTRKDDAAGNRTRACSVRGPHIVNVCDARRKPLVITFIFLTAADCEPQVDRVERIRAEFPDVEFLTVVSGEHLKRVKKLVADRGWHMPVAVDRDGAVTNVFGIGGCPTTIFAKRGGKVVTSELGNLPAAKLRALTRKVQPR